MSPTALWTTGSILFALTFLLSLLYASFNLSSRSRLEAMAAERRRLRGIEGVLAVYGDITVSLLILKHLAVLVLAALILLGPVIGRSPENGSLQAHVILEVMVLLFVVIVVCELIPRAIAERRGEFVILHMGRLARWIAVPAWPGLWCKRLVDGLVARVLPRPPDTTPGDELADDVLDAVSEVEREGAIRSDEREMIRSIISLRSVDVAEIMTPRTEMVGIEAAATSQNAIELMLQKGFSRLPVYQNTRDNILGIVHIKDLIRTVRKDPNKPLVEIASSPYFVPETKSIPEMLREFQQKKSHLAIVVDEYGGTAGLVTIEDIIEEIVGEIEDEYDTKTQVLLKRIDEVTVIADGRCRIDELNDFAHVQVPEDAEYDTVGGFAASTLGHIPAEGETFRHRDVVFTILEADSRRVTKVKVQVPAASGNWQLASGN